MQSQDGVMIEARPSPFHLDPATSAVVVVDMQNDFGANGGMFQRAGIDISDIQAVIPPISRLLHAARRAGMLVVYLKMEFEPDLSNAGEPDAPNWLTHLNLGGIGATVTAPDGSDGGILIRDTWNTAIVEEISPVDGDVVVSKHRFSGFFETELDTVLQARGITHLIFTGCTTSVCVESTLRDAYFRDYHSILLGDCCAEPIGAQFSRTNHDATVLLVEIMFGRVSDSTAFTSALAGVQEATPA